MKIMSTRSRIIIMNKNNTIKSIYCHSDGYLEYNGIILFNYYQDAQKVKELIDLGDLSSLGEEIHPNPNQIHNFDKRQEGVCCFYGRDRGEKETQAAEFNDIKELKADFYEEYNYLFKEKNNTWYLINTNNLKLLRLSSQLKKELTHTTAKRKKDFLQILKEKEIIKEKNILEKELTTQKKATYKKI